MATSKITYNGGLRTTAVHLQSGAAILTDAPVDNKGKGAAFSPTDLLATSLGSCMLTFAGIAAEEHGFNLEGTTCEIAKVMAENPRRVSEIVVEMNFPANNNFTEKQQTIIVNTMKKCAVKQSLHPSIVIKEVFNF